MFADTHCHLDFEVFDARLSSIMQAMQQDKLGFVVVPTVGVSNFERVEELCARYESLYMGLGLHPYFIREHTIADLIALESSIVRLLSSESGKLVAIGEIGLDASCPDIEKQQALFESQLALAEKFKLPVMVHSRQCNERMFKCLTGAAVGSGVIHAFSGSYELMMRYVHLGLKIGVGPVITWPGATKTRDAISRAPLDALVLETDAPGMFISGSSGYESSPLDVLAVFKRLVEIRSENEAELQDSLWQQSRALFRLDARR